MKIFVDVRLSLANLKGYSTDMTRNKELSEFAILLHKSIKKFEDSDFTLALGMFPNKLRFENFNNRLEFFGERKIVGLIKEDIIKECKDFSKCVKHYKDVRKEIKMISK
jgi:hypothetical protein